MCQCWVSLPVLRRFLLSGHSIRIHPESSIRLSFYSFLFFLSISIINVFLLLLRVAQIRDISVRIIGYLCGNPAHKVQNPLFLRLIRYHCGLIIFLYTGNKPEPDTSVPLNPHLCQSGIQCLLRKPEVTQTIYNGHSIHILNALQTMRVSADDDIRTGFHKPPGKLHLIRAVLIVSFCPPVNKMRSHNHCSFWPD